jgi:hypothetical protein
MCQDVIAVKPDVVVTEKGISGKMKKTSKEEFFYSCVCV